MASAGAIFLCLLLLLLLGAAMDPLAAASSSDRQNYASFILSRLPSIPSLLHSLLSRIANHRLARGDAEGASRARRMSEAMGGGGGLQFWRKAVGMAWDYLLHYSWRHSTHPSHIPDALALITELQAAIAELTQLRPASRRALWLSANHDRLLRITKSLLHKLLELFNRPGALRECVLAIRNEVTNGELLRDAMEIGSADLRGLVQVLKDMLQRHLDSETSSAYSDL